VDVPRFVREIADGRPLAAARTIFDDNLLGATCARVCPVEVLCESACVLVHEGRRPIEIARLQRYAADAALEANVVLRERAPRNGRRVVVIGAGPAGLACAGELASHGFDVDVYDAHTEVGGTIRTAIAPYRQVVEPLPAEREALARLGVRFHLGTRIEPDAALSALAEGADAVFLAVGLGADRALDCPGTELAGFWQSLEFVEALKRGYPPEVGDYVVVLGGGNTAVDVARESVRLGAAHVTIAYRRTRELMPAYAFEVDEALEEGVVFEWLAAPAEVVGATRVERIAFDRLRLGDADASGRQSLVPTGERFVLRADTVIAAIGQSAQPELLHWDLAQQRGAIEVDAAGRTSLPHVYAGGDVVNGGASVVQALMRSGKSVQSFPEYGPERRGAPLRAYTRYSSDPIRRHDSVEQPDLVVVLDESLLQEPAVSEGTSEQTPVVVSRSKDRMANVEMLGSVAAVLGEPQLRPLQDAAVEILGDKIPADDLRAAVAKGYRCRN
jgi:glutamate synthase (NADPH/NADH) small chain